MKWIADFAYVIWKDGKTKRPFPQWRSYTISDILKSRLKNEKKTALNTLGEILLCLPAKAWVQPSGFSIYLALSDGIITTWSYARNVVSSSIP